MVKPIDCRFALSRAGLSNSTAELLKHNKDEAVRPPIFLYLIF
jgi:hypothetical protein